MSQKILEVYKGFAIRSHPMGLALYLNTETDAAFCLTPGVSQAHVIIDALYEWDTMLHRKESRDAEGEKNE